MKVKVIQFKQPYGDQIDHVVDISDSCQEGYDKLIKCKCRLTVEILNNGMLSTCIEHEEGDFDMDITSNETGTEGIISLEKLISRFDEEKFNEWLKIFNS